MMINLFIAPESRLLVHILHFPFWLGDFVMALPMATAFASQHAGNRKIAVIDPALKPLLERCNLGFELWPYSKKERPALLLELKKLEQPAHVTLLTHSWGSIWPYRQAGIRTRGFARGLGGWLLHERVPREKGTQGRSNLQLLGASYTTVEPVFLLEPHLDPSQKKTLMVFPGAAYGPAKTWGAPAFVQLIKKILQLGWQVELHGAPSDVPACQEILRGLPAPETVKMLCGQLNLSQLLDHFAKTANPLCLANDSGAMHLCTACNIPTLGLYLSTSFEKTPPAFGPWQGLRSHIKCSPCYKRTCPLGHYMCRQHITPEQVVQNLLQLT